MPLPLLVPVALGTGSALATVLGIERGVRGHKATREAHRIADAATNRRLAARQDLDAERHQTTQLLVVLGETRLEAWDGPVRRFVAAMRAVKHIDVVSPSFDGTLPPLAVPSFAPLDIDFRPIDALRTAVTAGTTGGVAGLAALGSVGTFGIASTGASIGSLSGVAATNATLAWFGGGALSVGGLGMAGGQVVLGGVFAGPLILGGGLVLHARGRAALENARTYASQVKQAVAEAKLLQRNARLIGDHATTIRTATRGLLPLFEDRVAGLESVLRRTTDYRDFTDEERTLTRRTVELALVLKALLDLPLFDDHGTPSDQVEDLLRRAQAAKEAA